MRRTKKRSAGKWGFDRGAVGGCQAILAFRVLEIGHRQGRPKDKVTGEAMSGRRCSTMSITEQELLGALPTLDLRPHGAIPDR